MRKYKEIENGIIVSIGESLTNGTTISNAEYDSILQTIQNKPSADDGYDYRLKTDLTWERYELPKQETSESTTAAYTEEMLMQMTNAELESILAGYGESASMNKANLIRLILSLQGGDADA